MALTRPAELRQCRVRLARVYDGSRDLPAPGQPSLGRPSPGEAAAPRTGPGLALVAALSSGWGCFHTPAGKAVYFTLAFQTVIPEEEKTSTSEGEL